MKIFCVLKSQASITNYIFLVAFGVTAGLGTWLLVSISGANVAQASTIPADLEDKFILASRFYNSEDCFAYNEVVAGKAYTRVHTRVIDSSKFTQTNLNKCFPVSNVNYAFSLSLQALNFDEPPSVILELGPINTINWGGSFASEEIIEDVFVWHNGVKYKGKLAIKIKNVE